MPPTVKMEESGSPAMTLAVKTEESEAPTTPPAVKPEIYETSAKSSKPLQTISGNSSRAKRKSADANDATEDASKTNDTQKRQRPTPGVAADPPCQCTTASEEIIVGFRGLMVDTSFEGEMDVEVAAPTSKYPHGSIRLHGPKGYWNMAARFELSFADIDEVIVLRNRKLNAGKKQQYEVMIVMKQVVGMAPIIDSHNKMLSIILPDQDVDSQVYGSSTRRLPRYRITMLDLMLRALDGGLAKVDKTSIEVSQIQLSLISNDIFRIDTALEPVPATSLTKKTKGILQFLDKGVLFRSKEVNLWIPVRLLQQFRIIFCKDINKGYSDTNVVITVADSTESTATSVTSDGRYLLGFHRLSTLTSSPMYCYAKERNVRVALNQQFFQNHARNQPMTGYMPLPPGEEKKFEDWLEERPVQCP